MSHRGLGLTVLGLGTLLLACLFFRTQGGSRQPARPVASGPAEERRQDGIAPGAIRPGEVGQRTVQTPTREGESRPFFNPVRQRFRTALARYQELRKLDSGSLLGLAKLECGGWAVVRAWALAYPHEALESAVELIQGADSDEADRSLAQFVLGTLARDGDAAALARLIDLASGDQLLAERSVEELASLGLPGRPAGPILKWAALGNFKAIDALSFDNSVEAPQRLRILADTFASSGNSEKAQSGVVAEDAFKRSEVLQRPDWKDVVLDILSGRDERHYAWLPWALGVNERYPIEGALTALQERLQRAQESEIRHLLATECREPGVDLTNAFASSSVLPLNQFYFDDLLLAFWRSGGQLDLFQKARLSYYGMLGNPQEVLRTLLGKPSRW